MDARLIDRVETGIEAAAAAIFGGAVAYATLNWLVSPGPERWGYSAGAGILALVLCLRTMRMFGSHKPSLAVPIFNVRDIEPEVDELLLTDADRVGLAELVLTDADRLSSPPPDPLVLEDILTEIGPDARVVRLFDPKSMPTPAQLKARIDSHLGQGSTPNAPQSDASQALSEALAQLRRSLR
jgi:hypothetical protein